jgi:hypothetical protein
MGLLRGVARTAAIAGTATAVSNRVSRRQGNRWAQQDAQAEEQAAPPPPAAAAAPDAAAEPSAADQLALLKQLGELHADGTLTDEEFAAQKAKILG